MLEGLDDNDGGATKELLFESVAEVFADCGDNFCGSTLVEGREDDYDRRVERGDGGAYL